MLHILKKKYFEGNLIKENRMANYACIYPYNVPVYSVAGDNVDIFLSSIPKNICNLLLTISYVTCQIWS